MDEDTVAVGAHLHDLDVDGASMLDAGAVYVFTKPAAGWTSSTESAKLTATDGAAGDEFGISVAIDGDTVVTGAYRDDSMATDSDDGLDSGSVYVFDRDPESGKWSQTAKLTASNGDGGDRFGNSVAVDGDTAVVGAYLDHLTTPFMIPVRSTCSPTSQVCGARRSISPAPKPNSTTASGVPLRYTAVSSWRACLRSTKIALMPVRPT